MPEITSIQIETDSADLNSLYLTASEEDGTPVRVPIPNLTAESKIKKTTLWEGISLGGTLILSQSIDDFDYLEIVYDLDNTSSRWNQSFWVNVLESFGTDGLSTHEEADGEKWQRVTSTSILYTHDYGSSNNQTNKIIGIKL